MAHAETLLTVPPEMLDAAELTAGTPLRLEVSGTVRSVDGGVTIAVDAVTPMEAPSEREMETMDEGALDHAVEDQFNARVHARQ